MGSREAGLSDIAQGNLEQPAIDRAAEQHNLRPEFRGLREDAQRGNKVPDALSLLHAAEVNDALDRGPRLSLEARAAVRAWAARSASTSLETPIRGLADASPCSRLGVTTKSQFRAA